MRCQMSHTSRARLISLVAATSFMSLFTAGCGSPAPSVSPEVTDHMQFARKTLYDAPFPSDDLMREDRTIDVSLIPNPNKVEIIRQALSLIARDARGFAVSGAVYFSLTDAIDPARLPDLAASITPSASVFLMDLEKQARQPASVSFTADGGPFGAANLLSILPLQGIPMRPGKSYAAVIRRAITDTKSHPLGIAKELQQIAAGTRPTGLSERSFAAYRSALASLVASGVPASDIAGLAVFTTDNPEAGMSVFRTDILGRPTPFPSAPPPPL